VKNKWIQNSVSLLSAVGGSIFTCGSLNQAAFALEATDLPPIPALYIIKKGDSLSEIAQKTIGSPVFTPNGSLARLLAANPNLALGKRLEVGSQLKLPSDRDASATHPEEVITYVVEQANTLSQIAQQLMGSPVYTKNGSLARLRALNPQVKNPNRIHVGDLIYVRNRELQLAANEKPKGGHFEKPRRDLASVEEPDGVRSDFSLGMGFQYFSIDSKDRATGQNATLLSNAAPQFRFNWDLAWNPRWSARVRVDYQKEEILSFDDASGIVLRGAKGHRIGFLVGALRTWAPGSSTGLFIGRDEEIYERSPAVKIVQIERVGLPTVSVEQSHVFFGSSSASIGGALMGKLYLPAKANGFTTNTGWQLRPKVFLEHDLTVFRARAEAFYGFGRQDSNLVEQKVQSAGVLFQISKGFTR